MSTEQGDWRKALDLEFRKANRSGYHEGRERGRVSGIEEVHRDLQEHVDRLGQTGEVDCAKHHDDLCFVGQFLARAYNIGLETGYRGKQEEQDEFRACGGCAAYQDEGRGETCPENTEPEGKQDDPYPILEAKLTLREELRAIMRGEHSTNLIAHDLIREVTEWHEDGKPDLAEIRRREERAAQRRIESEAGKRRRFEERHGAKGTE